MNVVPLSVFHSSRVGLARAYQSVGVVGLLGSMLVVAALLLASIGWRGHQRFLQKLANAQSQTPPLTTVAPAPTLPPRVLPDAADVPRLLSRIERAATEAGLGWPRADYRFNSASDDVPASVEVRCTLKGPYPALRGLVAALLQDMPTLTLREFTISRNSADVAEVEAKLAVIIYVAGSPAMRP